ncbi:MAG TPA: T9SS type A sorting domain-containing protein [Caldithrix abyssi]|uniref:T9SS type A sorting domain-containing protein n=1 Tax=Caldithrix abyssi TaxID=187145 RepID=A0A7V4TZ63_CALAY|nr:T9SS type A sorting domain-containing protein [Caldithrix abyssi]
MVQQFLSQISLNYLINKKGECMKKFLFTILLIAILLPATTFAQWGNALHFTWQEHDRVIVPSAPDLFPFVLNAGTIEMWFKPDSILKSDTHDPDYTYLFSKNLGGNNEGDMGLTWKRGSGSLQCFVQDGNVTQDVYPDITIWEPRWYHIAYVWDTEDSMRVFIDGVMSADIEPNEEGETCLPVYGGTQEIVIGSGAVNLLDARFETFRGTIDEVRLSAIARYTSDFTPATQPFEVDEYTIALWHFDEGSGDVAEDVTGNGFTGILGDPDSVGYADPEWVKVQRDLKLLINEVLVDPATSVEDGDANGDGVRHAQEDEFVEFINVSGSPLDLTGWKVGDDERIDFQFPDGYVLEPYDFLTIFGGGDVSNVPGYDPDPLKTRVFATGDSIGNGLANSGDYLVVQSPDGNHDMYFAYGKKYGAGPPTSDAVSGIDTWEFEIETAADAGNNNSVTRYPDADQEKEDPFVEHLVASDSSATFSPNTTIDGHPKLSFSIDVNAVPASGGTVSKDPDSSSYTYGDYVSLQATPADFFVFDHWGFGDETNNANPLDIVVTGSQTYTAYFSNMYGVTPTIIVNELLADPSSDPILGDANGDGVRDGSQDEFVELINVGTEEVDMTGFQAGDDEQLSFTFPDGYIMKPGQIVAIFGGGDISNVPGYDADPLKTRVFVSDTTDKLGNGLANSGDYFLLISPDGSYDLYMGYNSKYNNGPPTSDVVSGIDFEIRIETQAVANNNNSVTRNPDGDVSVSDPFMEHDSVNGKPFSPAQTINGKDSLTTITNDDNTGLPRKFSLKQNYPNPFNPTTTIAFDVPRSSKIVLSIYNVRGQKIRTLVNQTFSPGRYKVEWDGKNNLNRQMPTGIYFYKIEADGFESVHKMILMK